jgi:hypothetical protein
MQHYVSRLRLMFVASLLLLLFTAFVQAASADTPTLGSPAANGVFQKADASENANSMRSGILIRGAESTADANPDVVYSVYVPDLKPSERFNIAAAANASYCYATGHGNSPGSPCESNTLCPGPNGCTNNPYSYNVHMKMMAYRATSATDTSTSWPGLGKDERVCSHLLHHCPLTLKLNGITGWGNAWGNYINVQMTAWTDSPNHQSGDMLELEGECTNGTGYGNCTPHPNDDQQSKSQGQLSVVRKGSTYAAGLSNSDSFSSSGPDVVTQTNVPINGTERVYSRRITGLEPGDVIEADGSMRVDGRNLGGTNVDFDHAVFGWWLLAKTSWGKVAGSGERYVSANNARNCLDYDGTSRGLCTTRQVGAVTVPSGANPTMYLNYVAGARDQTMSWGRVQLSNGSFDLACDPELSPDSSPLCAF